MFSPGLPYYHGLSGINNRSLFFRSSGGWKWETGCHVVVLVRALSLPGSWVATISSVLTCTFWVMCVWSRDRR